MKSAVVDMKFAVSVAVIMAVVACTPSPVPLTPTPDASDAAPSTADASTTCAAACAALAAVSCPLGASPSCPAFLQGQSDAGSLPNPAAGGKPLTCAAVAQVRTLVDAQRMGFACK